MRVVTGHKSIMHFETRITGLEAHSSQQHRGVPAVMIAGRLIHWLGEKQRENAENADPSSEFEPPYSTLHCGMIKGGTAVNITAKHCDFVTDIPNLAHEDPYTYFNDYVAFVRNVVEPSMQAISPEAHIDIKVHASVPGFESPADSDAVQLAKLLSGQNGTGCPYAAESGHQQAGFSVAMCGPGSIDQAHQPNEYISIEQLDREPSLFGD